MRMINELPLDEFCDYWTKDLEQYLDDGLGIEECVVDLVEAAYCIKQLRESIQYWSFCTRHGMLTLCPEKSEELKKLHESLGINPA